MNSLKFLYAAYIATWTIHVFYIATLVRRFSRLRRELADLQRSTKNSTSRS
jgi:CcmD family protein